MKHLISLKEQSVENIWEILNLAQEIKAKYKKGELNNDLAQKTLIMLFEKTSTRTRLSFEAAMTELGGHAIFLDKRTSQFALTDFSDEIHAVMRMGDIIMMRMKKTEDVLKSASLNVVPVIDGCSAKYHPAQGLGDILTIIENSKDLQHVKKIVWLGVENNVSNSLKLLCAKLGVNLVLLSPEANTQSVDSELNEIVENSGFMVKTTDIEEALTGADYIYTDTWMDMEFFENGKIKSEYEDKYIQRRKKFIPYQINLDLIKNYCPRAKIMHCMPCHIGYEITREAIHHENSIIFDQAENRKHAQKAMLVWLLGGGACAF